MPHKQEHQEQKKQPQRMEDVIAKHGNETFTQEAFHEALAKVFPRPLEIKDEQRLSET